MTTTLSDAFKCETKNNNTYFKKLDDTDVLISHLFIQMCNTFFSLN